MRRACVSSLNSFTCIGACLPKGVRTRMFCLIIYLPCFDHCVLFCFLVFCSVLFRLQLSVVRPNRSQVVRIELPCISVS